MKKSPPLKSNLVCWLERRRASKGKAARPLNKGAGKRDVAFHDPKACGGVSNHVSLLLHSWFHPRAEGVAPITAGSLDPEGLPFFEKSPVILALPYSSSSDDILCQSPSSPAPRESHVILSPNNEKDRSPLSS